MSFQYKDPEIDKDPEIEFNEKELNHCIFSDCPFYRGAYIRDKFRFPIVVLCTYQTEGRPHDRKRKIHWTNCPRIEEDH